jgi:serine/threonine-protein kinase RsbW
LDSVASVNQCALPDAVPAIRAAVSRFLDGLGVPLTRSVDIQLAVTEACANVVRHAYPQGPGPIRCDARLVDGAVVVCIRDWGCAFSDPAADPGLGLGTSLMESLADRVDRSHVDGEKLVALTFSRDLV